MRNIFKMAVIIALLSTFSFALFETGFGMETANLKIKKAIKGLLGKVYY